MGHVCTAFSTKTYGTEGVGDRLVIGLGFGGLVTCVSS